MKGTGCWLCDCAAFPADRGRLRRIDARSHAGTCVAYDHALWTKTHARGSNATARIADVLTCRRSPTCRTRSVRTLLVSTAYQPFTKAYRSPTMPPESPLPMSGAGRHVKNATPKAQP